MFTQLTTEHNRGFYYGIFGGIFSASGVFGCLFAWIYFAQHALLDAHTVYTFYVSLTILVVIASATLLLVTTPQGKFFAPLRKRRWAPREAIFVCRERKRRMPVIAFRFFSFVKRITPFRVQVVQKHATSQ